MEEEEEEEEAARPTIMRSRKKLSMMSRRRVEQEEEARGEVEEMGSKSLSSSSFSSGNRTYSMPIISPHYIFLKYLHDI